MLKSVKVPLGVSEALLCDVAISADEITKIISSVKRGERPIYLKSFVSSSTLTNLSKSEKQELVQCLKESLNSSNWEEQVSAAFVLGELGPIAISAVPNMTKAMDTKMANVRWEVIPALVKIGPMAIPYLQKQLEVQPGSYDEILHNKSVSKHFHNIIDALGEFGPAAAPAVPEIYNLKVFRQIWA